MITGAELDLPEPLAFAVDVDFAGLFFDVGVLDEGAVGVADTLSVGVTDEVCIGVSGWTVYDEVGLDPPGVGAQPVTIAHNTIRQIEKHLIFRFIPLPPKPARSIRLTIRTKTCDYIGPTNISVTFYLDSIAGKPKNQYDYVTVIQILSADRINQT